MSSKPPLRRRTGGNETEIARHRLTRDEIVLGGQGFVRHRPGSSSKGYPGLAREVSAGAEAGLGVWYLGRTFLNYPRGIVPSIDVPAGGRTDAALVRRLYDAGRKELAAQVVRGKDTPVYEYTGVFGPVGSSDVRASRFRHGDCFWFPAGSSVLHGASARAHASGPFSTDYELHVCRYTFFDVSATAPSDVLQPYATVSVAMGTAASVTRRMLLAYSSCTTPLPFMVSVQLNAAGTAVATCSATPDVNLTGAGTPASATWTLSSPVLAGSTVTFRVYGPIIVDSSAVQLVDEVVQGTVIEDYSPSVPIGTVTSGTVYSTETWRETRSGVSTPGLVGDYNVANWPGATYYTTPENVVLGTFAETSVAYTPSGVYSTDGVTLTGQPNYSAELTTYAFVYLDGSLASPSAAEVSGTGYDLLAVTSPTDSVPGVAHINAPSTAILTDFDPTQTGSLLTSYYTTPLKEYLLVKRGDDIVARETTGVSMSPSNAPGPGILARGTGIHDPNPAVLPLTARETATRNATSVYEGYAIGDTVTTATTSTRNILLYDPYWLTATTAFPRASAMGAVYPTGSGAPVVYVVPDGTAWEQLAAVNTEPVTASLGLAIFVLTTYRGTLVSDPDAVGPDGTAFVDEALTTLEEARTDGLVGTGLKAAIAPLLAQYEVLSGTPTERIVSVITGRTPGLYLLW